MANRFHHYENFGHVIGCAWAKQLLEPMQWLATHLQGNSGFRKIEEMIHIYKETGGKVDELFQ